MNGVATDQTIVEREATEWFVRLQSDGAGERDWLAFETWLGTSDAHQAAFQKVEALWIDLEAADNPASALNPNTVVAFKVRKLKPLGIWLASGAIAAALVIGVGAPSLWHIIAKPATPAQTISTAKGERRMLTLGDGTRIDMNSATTLTVRLDRHERTLDLLGGEVACEVAHDPSRPFAVRTGDRRITDIGTVFDVLRQGHSTHVTVEKGEVAVTGVGDASNTVIAGQQLVHEDGAANSTVHAVDVANALAWRSGRLIYHDATLRTLAAELSEYFPTPIRVQDNRTAELQFSGVLVLDSEDAVVGRLQAFLPVAAERSNGAIILRARRHKT